MLPDARAFEVGDAFGLFLEAIDVSSSWPVRRSDPTSHARPDCQGVRLELIGRGNCNPIPSDNQAAPRTADVLIVARNRPDALVLWE